MFINIFFSMIHNYNCSRFNHWLNAELIIFTNLIKIHNPNSVLYTFLWTLDLAPFVFEFLNQTKNYGEKPNFFKFLITFFVGNIFHSILFKLHFDTKIIDRITIRHKIFSAQHHEVQLLYELIFFVVTFI